MFFMCRLSKAIVLVPLFSAAVILAKAQSYKWMVGANAGAMVYQGDLTPSSPGSYKTAQFTFGVNVAKILTPSFAIRANAVLGKLKGDDARYSDPSWRQSRNLNFSTPVTEISGQLLWNIFGNNSNELRQRLSPYLFAGAGISFMDIQRDFSRLDTTVFPFNTKTSIGLKTDTAVVPPRSLLVLPAGVGLAFYVSPRWSLNYELAFRYTFSDYIDGFSKGADPNQKDFYHTQTLGLVYRFGGDGGAAGDRLGCPKY